MTEHSQSSRETQRLPNELKSSFTPRIFINYRRDDAAGDAGRLYDALSARFGEAFVFMDVDAIRPGADFAEVISEAVGSCDVLVTVIGKNWLNLTDASGKRRLDDQHDLVRLEIQSALEREIRVIPMLVQGAQMPRPDELPGSLATLAGRNAFEISHARWKSDVERLIATLETRAVLHGSGNLPAEVTSFVGRRRELAELRKKIKTARLVSLVGPGGVGKTRLAIRTATDLGSGFAAGAWLVSLADVRDAGLVANAAVAALDLRDQAAMEPLQILLSHLQDKQLLLVLDNCEHLLDAAAQLVVEVLRTAPNVRVITTSREPLQIPGEHVVPLAPLELPPDDGTVALSQLRQNEAVMLFTERAAAASGTFELTDSNQAAVVNLCRRLDGLPLAIELAAVRTRVLTTEQILERLTDRFALLTGGSRAALPRQQTLQTTIDWSYDLLTAGEQALFRRLCVFAGRFTFDDMEAVCAFDDVPVAQALTLLSSLVDKSLVMKEDVKRFACYRLQETMREYASLKLRDANEVDVLEERCLVYYRTRCLGSAEQARYQPLEWMEWTELEIDNIRLVLQRCLARGDFARGLALAASIGHYWVTRATTESVRWFDQLLASGEASPQTQVRAYYLRGWLSLIQGDPAAARPWLARAVAKARESGQLGQLSESLSMAANADAAIGDFAAASGFLNEAQAITAGLDDYPATIELVSARAVDAFFRGDLDTASGASLEGVRISREAGDLFQLESMLRNLGGLAMMAGDLGTAKLRFVEALRIAQQIDHRIEQYYLLAALGWHAAGSDQARLAAQLLGAAETVATGAGAIILGPTVPLLAAAKESAIAALGASKFEAEFNTGKRLSREAALRLALGESDQAELGARRGR